MNQSHNIVTNPSTQTSEHKVLLVEDNPADAVMVKLMLEETNLLTCNVHHVETLGDGMKALEKDKDISAVLLDMNLPDSNGMETLETLISRFPEKNIIVLTGTNDKTMGIEAVKKGAQDFVVKEYNMDGDELAKKIRFSIERQRMLKRLEIAQKIANIGSWEYNPTTKEFSSSGVFCRMFGFQADALFSAEELEDPSHPIYILNELHNEVQEKGEYKVEDTQIKQQDGTNRWVMIQCYTNRDVQNSLVINGVIQDITDLKQAEELKRQSEINKRSETLKEKFIAGISHEMRTPMNAIYGMSNLLVQTPLNEEQLNYVSSIQKSSTLLLGIINDILEMSTIHNGKVEFDYKDMNLVSIIENLEKVMEYKTTEKDLAFDLQVDKDIPKILIGDELRLTQVLYNLVGNAIKFTERGFVKVNVDLVKRKGKDIRLKFTVRDSGIGIPDDKVDAVFDSFTRVRDKNKIYEGTGLGLALAKNYVQLMNGKIGATSEFGKGSVFFFELPFVVSESTTAAVAKEEYPDIDVDPNMTFKLLLAEDHKINQLVAKNTLTKQWPNMTMAIANNGEEAIELLEKDDYDIILMDIQMPGMDGYEATNHIRNKMSKEKAALPILAMTAHANISKDDTYKKHGMDDYVLKPFEPMQLFKKITKYVLQSK